MKMRENMKDLYRLFTTDETLLRLLYYKPTHGNDDPIDESKPNILDMDVSERWGIIEDRIKTTPTSENLDKEAKCRLLFYPGRRSNTDNYYLANQEIYFDVLSHFNYDGRDMRLSWICDHINNLIFDKKITGIGNVLFESGQPIEAPESYIGYRLRYSIGSGKNGVA
ncbi:hypothetical protein [Chengkuizengella marina]|uniref:Uncharacterized protein n=1 Tax=Chengkuizengella marina TaxID=2507566 RepID=A0A6N9Q253_9BACL|nr:hypothetical protein [Chengkuizengella marina]NBI28600.1 hypothetical protein [Chengkuizengella marina]